MAGFIALTLNDGQATPVAHTFSPAELLTSPNNTALWQDRASGVGIGFTDVTFEFVRPKGQRVAGTSTNNRVYRVKAGVTLPVLETLGNSASGFTAAPTVAYTLRANVEFILPERATTAQRADILAYCRNLMAGTVMGTAVTNLETIY